MGKPKLWMHRLWQLPKGHAISQGNWSQKFLIKAIFTYFIRRSSRSFWEKISPTIRSTSRASTFRPSIQEDKREVWADSGQAGGPFQEAAVKWVSGAKRPPEFLLKVTFTILVLWTWNWIKVGGTCPFPLWFHLGEIQGVTKKLLSISPFREFCHLS